MKTTTLSNVLKRLDNIFSLFGFPQEIITDNGPPWTSSEMDSYFTTRNIKHKTLIPLWPRSNGQAESFMKVINKTIRHSVSSKSNIKDALTSTLLNYRNFPHPATGETPLKLFLNRSTNIGIPNAKPQISLMYNTVNEYHEKYIGKVVNNANKKCSKERPMFKIGDQVWMKRGKKDNKFQSNYYCETFSVIETKNTMITVKKNDTNQIYKRHFTFFKKIINEESGTPAIETNTQPYTASKRYALRSNKETENNDNN